MIGEKWLAIGKVKLDVLQLWDRLKPVFDKARDRMQAPEYRSGLFGSFLDPGTCTVSGRLESLAEPDPEDHKAVVRFVQLVGHQLGEEEIAKRIEWTRKELRVDPDEHIFSIGGPRSSDYSKPVGYDLAHGGPKPRLPIYFLYDSKWQSTSPNDFIVRRFDGRDHKVGVWKVHIEGMEDLAPDLHPNGRLQQSDYLLVTMMPNLKTARSKANARVHCIISGLYGPGVMAIDMLLANKNGALRVLDEERSGRTAFQSLFKIHGVRHEERFSFGDDIEHLHTVPLESAQYLAGEEAAD